MPTAPRVFISYVWKECRGDWPDEDYRRWVRRLATRLRADGIDARLDAWHMAKGQGITGFMNAEVEDADLVVVLCSPRFREAARAADRGEEPSGAGWEYGLVAARMFQRGAADRVVPVMTRGERWADVAPVPLVDRPHIDLSRPAAFEAEYRRLLQRLAGKGEKPPPLGELAGDLDPEPVPPLAASSPEGGSAEPARTGPPEALSFDRSLDLRPGWEPEPLPSRPYPLLAPYKHPATFGGRDVEVEELLALLVEDWQVLCFYASSGAGKSSLLQAGLLPRLSRAHGDHPLPVAYDREPLSAGLGVRLARSLVKLSDEQARRLDTPQAVVRLLQAVTEQEGQPPLLILDQVEDIFRDDDEARRVCSHLGSLLALCAGPQAPGTPRPARWLLSYRHEFHGQVWSWLQDPLREARSLLPPEAYGVLPQVNLVERGACRVYFVPSFGEPGPVKDPVETATERFLEAIARPLDLTTEQGVPRYPCWRMAPAGRRRLACAFARVRHERPHMPLTPELQVVLDQLYGAAPRDEDGQRTLEVPREDEALRDRLRDALGRHIRAKLDEAFPPDDRGEARKRRTRALLAMRSLVHDARRARGRPVDEMQREWGQEGPDLLDALQAPNIRLLLKIDVDGQFHYVLPHDRLAEAVDAIFQDPAELRRYALDEDLVTLSQFVQLRVASWESGDTGALSLAGRRYRDLLAREDALPWTDRSRAWWGAAKRNYRRNRRRRVAWGLVAVVVVVAVVGGAFGIVEHEREKARREKRRADLMGDLHKDRPAAFRAAADLSLEYGVGGDVLLDELDRRVDGERNVLIAFGWGSEEREGSGGEGDGAESSDGRTSEEAEEMGPAAISLVSALCPHAGGRKDEIRLFGALAAALFGAARNEERYPAVHKRLVEAMRKGVGAPPPQRDEEDWSDIISGTFAVGCDPETDDCLDNELPRHHVVLSSFRILDHEVTVGEYMQFDRDYDPPYMEGAPNCEDIDGPDEFCDYPVMPVDWYEAMAYATWLGGRLPTEAEWEVASRGGEGTPWAGTADPEELCRYANVEFSHCREICEREEWEPCDRFSHTAPVRSLEPNGYGLYDMSGNVWEWVWDAYSRYPGEKTLSDPAGPAGASPRVVRGGSCGNGARWVRSACRDRDFPWNDWDGRGFRVLLPRALDP